MSVLPRDLADRVEREFGAKISEFARHKAAGAEEFMSKQAAALRVLDQAVPVSISGTDPVLDLGGRHRNDAWLLAPMLDLGSSAITDIASDTLKRKVTSRNSRAVFLTHRFLDVGASNRTRSLVITNCSAVLYSAVDTTQKTVDFILIDAAGARVLKQPAGNSDKLRKGIPKTAPDRKKLSNVDLGSVYVRIEGRLQQINIRKANKIKIPFAVSDGTIVGATHERLTLQPAQNTADAGEISSGSAEASVIYSGRTYPASTSFISGIIGVSGRYGGGPDAPNGYVWGDPISATACSRSSRDNCLSCCDNIMLGYAGAAGTAVIGGLLTGSVTVPGIGTVAGWAVGCVIGVVLLGVGAIHSGSCRSSCNQLYNYGTGDSVKNQKFRLTAAEYDSGGEQIAYEVQDEATGVTARWSRENLVQLAWGGADITIDANGAKGKVQVVSGPKKGIYIRARADERSDNNMAQLPSAV